MKHLFAVLVGLTISCALSLIQGCASAEKVEQSIPIAEVGQNPAKYVFIKEKEKIMMGWRKELPEPTAKLYGYRKASDRDELVQKRCWKNSLYMGANRVGTYTKSNDTFFFGCMEAEGWKLNRLQD